MTMLAYYHFNNKGRLPFDLAGDPAKSAELAAEAELNEDQMMFVKKTAKWIRQKRKTSVIRRLPRTSTDFQVEEHVKHIRAERDFGDHYFFLSQLFDEDWQPSATA